MILNSRDILADLPEIENGIARGSSAKEQARAAYMAICLDLAPALKQKYPERWQSAIGALSGFCDGV